MTKSDNWSEYTKLVMDKLSSHDKNFDKLAELIGEQGEGYNNLKVELKSDIVGIKVSLENIRKNEATTEQNTKDIAVLKVGQAQLEVKSGIWGAAGGIFGFIALVIGIWAQSGFDSIVSLFSKR